MRHTNCTLFSNLHDKLTVISLLYEGRNKRKLLQGWRTQKYQKELSCIQMVTFIYNEYVIWMPSATIIILWIAMATNKAPFLWMDIFSTALHTPRLGVGMKFVSCTLQRIFWTRANITRKTKYNNVHPHHQDLLFHSILTIQINCYYCFVSKLYSFE